MTEVAKKTWFGRDPAIVTAQIVSLVIALVVLSSMPEEVEAAVAAVVTFAGGVVVAFAVAKDGQVAAIVGFARAGIALLVLVEFDWSPEYQALLLVAVEQVAAFLFIKPAVVAKVDENGTPRAALTRTM
jgi:uncharacterized membrane protein